MNKSVSDFKKSSNKMRRDITHDLLDSDTNMIDRNQKWSVIGIVAEDPTRQNLRAMFMLELYLRQECKNREDSFLKKFFENDKYNIDDLIRRFSYFTDKNIDVIEKKFDKAFPECTSDPCNGLIKPWGCFATKKQAYKQVNKIQRRGEQFYHLYIYETGMWGEYNPNPLLMNPDYIIEREQKMQDYMRFQQTNNIKGIEDFKRRQKIITLHNTIRNKEETKKDITDDDFDGFTKEELNFEFTKYDQKSEYDLLISDPEASQSEYERVRDVLLTEIKCGRGDKINIDAVKKFKLKDEIEKYKND